MDALLVRRGAGHRSSVACFLPVIRQTRTTENDRPRHDVYSYFLDNKSAAIGAPSQRIAHDRRAEHLWPVDVQPVKRGELTALPRSPRPHLFC